MKEEIKQQEVINSNDNLLVLASAGCGKTTTIINKVNKILSGVNENEILIISFTNETVNDLKKKLPNISNIYTFHKLALNIIKNKYRLCNDNFIDYIINEYFNGIISNKDKNKLLLYFMQFNYKKLLNCKYFISYKKIIKTYIKQIKANSYSLTYFNNFYKSSKDKFLLKIIMTIYYLYESEKKSQNLIDLDDLIIIASETAKQKKFQYKYIFVDEFQDSSYIRFNLIHNIFINSKSIINFFGDDYQSIYAFSGCNLDIMLNISNTIKDIKIITLNKNFRSDNKLIISANKFIEENPAQIKKDISSNKFVDNSINFIYYKNLDQSVNKVSSQIKSKDILVLGRYKHDLITLKEKYRCLTIHESKGLEADYVIIINLKNDTFGFPSKIKNDRLLNIFNKTDDFLYAEERRLFYVAITRAKKKVFLLTPYQNPSIFCKEFKYICKSIF